MLVKLLPKSEISARENLKWLFILRNLLLLAESLLILMSEYVLRISLPLDGLWLAIIAIGAVNAFTWLRLNSDVPARNWKFLRNCLWMSLALPCCCT